VTENRGVPPISDYAHWNEDAERVWYEENKYDMMYPPEPEYDYESDHAWDHEIDPDDCAMENDYHQANTQGRFITFAGVEVYDQQECSNCYIALSVAWPRGS
jgi:hypothetical protein